MGGTYGSAPSGALGAGFVPQTRSQVARTTTRLQKLLDQAGVSYQRDTSRVSPSEYFYVDTPAGDTVKARISQHADRYGSDFSVAPGDSGFDDLLSYLRDQGVSIPDRVSSAATKFANAKAALGQKWAYSTWHGLDDEAQQLAKQIQAVSNPQELAKAQNAFDDLTQRSADNFRDTTGIEPTGKMFIDSMIYRRAAGEIDDQAVRNWFAKHSPEIQGQVSGMLDNLSAPANH